MGLQAKSVITTSFARDDRGYFFLGLNRAFFTTSLWEKKLVMWSDRSGESGPGKD